MDVVETRRLLGLLSRVDTSLTGDVMLLLSPAECNPDDRLPALLVELERKPFGSVCVPSSAGHGFVSIPLQSTAEGSHSCETQLFF